MMPAFFLAAGTSAAPYRCITAVGRGAAHTAVLLSASEWVVKNGGVIKVPPGTDSA